MRISYPSEWNFACPSCGERVKFRYSDDGKLVHTLEGPIYQVVNLYYRLINVFEEKPVA